MHQPLIDEVNLDALRGAGGRWGDVLVLLGGFGRGAGCGTDGRFFGDGGGNIGGSLIRG